jgi:hypothetical protein
LSALPSADGLSLARDASAALASLGWRTARAAVHSGGTADVAAARTWSRGKLSARVRLVIRCDSRPERLLLSSLDDAVAGDRIPSYSFGDDDPAQRRTIGEIIPTDRLHRAAYPRELAVTDRARLDALPPPARGTALRDAVLDEAFTSVDAIRRDLLQFDLDVVRDDLDIDRGAGAETAIQAALRCDLIYPIVITDADIHALPARTRRDWIRIERSALVGGERRWIDVVQAAAFSSYAGALTRHIESAYRRRRFAPA